MSLVLFIYLAEMISKLMFFIKILMFFSFLFTALFVLIMFIISADEDVVKNRKERIVDKLFKYSKHSSIVLISSIIVYLSVPSEKTMYLMAGAYIGQEVATSEIVSEKLNKINKIIDLKLDEIINEYSENLKEIKN